MGGEEIQGWEIKARLSVDDADFKERLRQAEQAVGQTRQRVSNATGGAGAGGTVQFGGRRMPVAEAARFLGITPEEFTSAYGGGAGGGAGASGVGGGQPRSGWTLPPPAIRRGVDPGPQGVAERRATASELIEVFGQGRNAESIKKMVENADGIAKESGKAKGEWSRYAVSMAYAARHILSGSRGGMVGGGIGALAGLAIAGPYGAYLGSVGGSAVSGAVSDAGASMAAQNRADVELGNPALARQRELAERDRQAARGRASTGAYRFGTTAEQYSRDFYASGGRDVSGVLGDAWSTAMSAYSIGWTAALAKIQGTQIKSGAGAGLAPNAQLGHFFGGDEFYKAMVGTVLSQTPPASLDVKAGGGAATVQDNTEAVKELTAAVKETAANMGTGARLTPHMAQVAPVVENAAEVGMAAGAGWAAGGIASWLYGLGWRPNPGPSQ